jgi:3-hydroxyacyl-CoA dehydrogenase/enoyl-CoA hydratase/3-hydroxybutyryl-CoA epimerase
VVRVDDSVSGLVVASSCERFFSAGADVGAFAAASQRGRLMTCLNAQEVFTKLERLPFPTVAAIAGACLGGGLELALCCRHRLAAAGSYAIGLPEVEVGLLPGSGGTQRLPRLIGLARGLELIVSGRLLTPAEALEAGLVDRLLPAGESILEAAVELAQRSGQEEDD